MSACSDLCDAVSAVAVAAAPGPYIGTNGLPSSSDVGDYIGQLGTFFDSNGNFAGSYVYYGGTGYGDYGWHYVG